MHNPKSIAIASELIIAYNDFNVMSQDAFSFGVDSMKTITVRGIDDVLGDKLKQMAHEKNMSINQFIIDALKRQAGLTKEKQFTVVHDDLDHLFGRWSQEEFEAIQGKIDSERVIDPELWV